MECKQSITTPLTDKFSTPDGSCLGGDDNSGTYVIMLELMRNNVPYEVCIFSIEPKKLAV